MSKKVEYKDSQSFMFDCVRNSALPTIHWRTDEDGNSRGFIWFKASKFYASHENEIHIFYSNDKKMLDTIWNSIGLIRHAVKLVDEVKNV